MSTQTDPIADMLTRIRNAIAVRKDELTLPHSKLKESVAQVLVDTRFINSYRVVEATVGKTLAISLTDGFSSSPITEIKRISTPGRRYYAKAAEIPTIKRGRGVVLVSTSQGLMTGKEARRKGVGGELICSIY